jgi:hypothetical protein
VELLLQEEQQGVWPRLPPDAGNDTMFIHVEDFQFCTVFRGLKNRMQFENK